MAKQKHIIFVIPGMGVMRKAGFQRMSATIQSDKYDIEWVNCDWGREIDKLEQTLYRLLVKDFTGNRIYSFLRHLGSSYIGDAIMYLSSEGEKFIREQIYEILIGKLKSQGDMNFKFSIIGHSLGSVIGYDFIYRYLIWEEDTEARKEKEKLIYKETKKKFDPSIYNFIPLLKMFISMGSPLALYLLRIPKLLHSPDLEIVKKRASLIFTSDFSKSDKKCFWVNFYDEYDLVGSALGSIYGENNVRDIKVSNRLFPSTTSHTGYWDNPKVISTISEYL